MRMLSVIAAADAAVATASLGFAQPQAPAPPSRAPLEAPECQRGAYRPRAKQPEAPRSVIGSRDRKALSVPQPALTLE